MDKQIDNKKVFLTNIVNSYRSIPIDKQIDNFSNVETIYIENDEKIENIKGLSFEYRFDKPESKYRFNTKLSVIPRSFLWIDFSSYYLKVSVVEKNTRGYSDKILDTIYYESSEFNKDIKSIYEFIKNRISEIKNNKIANKYNEYNSLLEIFIDKSLTRDDKLSEILKTKKEI